MAAFDPRRAWEPYKPSSENPWDLKKVGHLYRRAGFGATWTELEAGVKNGPDKTINLLLKGQAGDEEMNKISADMAQGFKTANNGQQLPAWWLFRMVYTTHPLQEKMTLFWHNHFATSNAKVQNAAFMLGQHELMRKYALGSFRTMLQDMSKDPAMLVWLDTNLSKKGMPNENYARELMELFSLGIGNYTETDIREAAKAFTGWDIQDGKYFFKAKEHDQTTKKVLGKTGNFNGEDIVSICLDQKSAPGFIVGKLYRYLISETAPAHPEVLEALAAQYKKSDFDTGALVETMLRSNLFFSPLAYRARVKAPVDYALGIIRALEGKIGTTALAVELESLGQRIFYPPSVKGWDGGTSWLNSQTLLFRQNLALALTSTEDPRFGRRTDPALLVQKHGKKSGADPVDFFLQLFLQGDVPAESRDKLVRYEEQARQQKLPVYWTKEDGDNHRLRSLCHLVLSQPEFQLD